ncbi:MAG: response regulator transcription factor [Nitrospiraceae bacterium]|jgi:DNA-binding response OmpR family regulator|nr:response regulator transcription factor [Nitrospiraceae bacterium]
MNILLIEDDERISSFLKRGLEAEGHVIDLAQNGHEGFDKGMNPADVIILDLLLPDKNGDEVCQDLRREGIKTPILMLTAKDALEDKLHGFDCGADDYLTKPFEFEELLVRLKALSRRQPLLKTSEKLQVADLTLDRDSQEVYRGKEQLTLTRKEFLLLEFLMTHANKAVSRTSILERVWGYHHDTLTNSVDVYIGFLRKKIDTGRERKLLHTVRDFGYKIKDPD